MKLDHRRTILVGLAFLSICAFWQMYDSVIPKILTETFHLNETLSGAIMALDNILALFLLPLFGALSDHTSTKIGRRMPFILLGTACAAVLMNLLPVLDNRYAAAPSTGKLVGFAAVLGLLLDDWMDAHLYNSVVVAIMLIVYGVAFILIERRPRVPDTTKLSRITYKQALIVGAWQVLALIPGTSRSGATIIGGLLCGMSRACASQFTFFLAIPVMAGASGLKLVKFLAKGGVFTLGEVGTLLVGCIVAFVVSILAIRFLMDYVKKHTFTVFGWYRIALGILVLGIWALQSFVLA